MCMNMASMFALRYMAKDLSLVWSPFDAYSDQYSLLRL